MSERWRRSAAPGTPVSCCGEGCCWCCCCCYCCWGVASCPPAHQWAALRSLPGKPCPTSTPPLTEPPPLRHRRLCLYRLYRRGPLYYVIVLVAATALYWRGSPVGLVAASLMCGGDGLADIVGRRLGRGHRLPWNADKSWAGSAAMFAGGGVGPRGMGWWR